MFNWNTLTSPGISKCSNKLNQIFVLFSSRQKLREWGGLDGLVRGRAAGLAAHDRKPRGSSRVHSDAAVEHAQVQHMNLDRSTTEERITGRERSGGNGLKLWGESWRGRAVKKKSKQWLNWNRSSLYFLSCSDLLSCPPQPVMPYSLTHMCPSFLPKHLSWPSTAAVCCCSRKPVLYLT